MSTQLKNSEIEELLEEWPREATVAEVGFLSHRATEESREFLKETFKGLEDHEINLQTAE